MKNFMEQNYELEEGETRESNAYKMAEQNTLCEVLIERALVGDEESGVHVKNFKPTVASIVISKFSSWEANFFLLFSTLNFKTNQSVSALC